MVEVPPAALNSCLRAGPVNTMSCSLLPSLWGKHWAGAPGAPQLMSCSQAPGLVAGWWLCSKTSSSLRLLIGSSSIRAVLAQSWGLVAGRQAWVATWLKGLEQDDAQAAFPCLVSPLRVIKVCKDLSNHLVQPSACQYCPLSHVPWKQRVQNRFYCTLL